MNFFPVHTYKVLIGIVSIAVCRSRDSVFLGLFDDVLHVLDVLDGYRHELLQQIRGNTRPDVCSKAENRARAGARRLPECAAGTSGHS